MSDKDWKHAIPNYSDYKINKAGDVFSYRRLKSGRKLVRTTHYQGYKYVKLHNNEGEKLCFIHRLLAQTFIPNPEGKKEINHINSVKDDNRIENLEWCTRQENMDHAMQNNLLPLGENTPNVKLKHDDIKVIRSLSEGGTSKRNIARLYNVSHSAINDIFTGRTWSHI